MDDEGAEPPTAIPNFGINLKRSSIMAKKATTKKPAVETAAKTVTKSTPVRNSAIPKVIPAAAPVAKKVIGQHEIAVRAYEIAMSGTGGDELSNWLCAVNANWAYSPNVGDAPSDGRLLKGLSYEMTPGFRCVGAGNPLSCAVG